MDGRRGGVLSMKGHAEAWVCFGFVVRDQTWKYIDTCIPSGRLQEMQTSCIP